MCFFGTTYNSGESFEIHEPSTKHHKEWERMLLLCCCLLLIFCHDDDTYRKGETSVFYSVLCRKLKY